MERDLPAVLFQNPKLQHAIVDENLLATMRQDTCAICLMGFREGALATAFECAHSYHYCCALTHLSMVAVD